MKGNKLGFSWMQDWVSPPFSWLYSADAEIHDSEYDKGGTKQDRLKADLGFFWRMMQDTNQINDFKVKKKAVRTAILYYFLVRTFGWIAFSKKKDPIREARKRAYITYAIEKSLGFGDVQQIIKEAGEKFDKANPVV